MRAFLSLLIMPLSIFWLLFFFGLFLKLKKYNKASNWILSASMVFMLCISTSFIPDYLIKRMEGRYAPITNADSLSRLSDVKIIVLGAGHSDDSSLPPNNMLSLSAQGRLIEGIRLHNLIPGSKLIVSGAQGRLSVSQAEIMKRAAISLGVHDSDILLLPNTRNTADEARSCFSLTGNLSPLILVTDATHLPRAMVLFQKAGMKPIPAPANNYLKKGSVRNPFSWAPSSLNILKMETLFHEYAGMILIRTGLE